jgi:hypothetical protein
MRQLSKAYALSLRAFFCTDRRIPTKPMADSANRLQYWALDFLRIGGVFPGAAGRLSTAASGQVRTFSLKGGV